MANAQVSEAEKDDNIDKLPIDTKKEAVIDNMSKKTDDVAVAASIMEAQKSEQPNIFEQLLGSLDSVCGAPKLEEIINKEDHSKESSAADFPIVTELAPLSNLSVLGEVMRNPSLCSIVTNINDGYDTFTKTLNEAIFPVPTESAQSSSLSAEKVEEERLKKAANMAKKALDKEEVTEDKKATFRFAGKFGKRS